MNDIQFTADETAQMVDKIKRYFESELHQDIGGFDAEFLIQFFAKEMGGLFYNKGVQDASALVAERTEEIGYLLNELEKTPPR